MSLSNCIRIPISVGDIDLFTCGESIFYGYDQKNVCLIYFSLNNSNKNSFNRLNLSEYPKYRIRQLILNEDETIIALISNQIIYLVYLPKLTRKTSFKVKDNCICPVKLVQLKGSDNSSIENYLIDFVWLSSKSFLIVQSIPSPSECHLYRIKESKSNEIEFVQSYSVGLSTKVRQTTNRISLENQSNIIQLKSTKRKRNSSIIISILAIKDNGEIFIMDLDQYQLNNHFGLINGSFVGPMLIYPSTFDNYGSNYQNSIFVCLSSRNCLILLFTNDRHRINQSILIEKSANEYCLFTIDTIDLSTNPNQLIKSIVNSKLNPLKCYVSDSYSNIYSIEILFSNQIQINETLFDKPILQHLIQSNHSIEHFNLIETNSSGQYLAMIINNPTIHQQKELILLRPYSLLNLCSIKSSQSNQFSLSNKSSEIVNQIEDILHCDDSFPQLTLSSSSTPANLSVYDFQMNLIKSLKFFENAYLSKQVKAKLILENKQKYFNDFEQIQSIAIQELNNKLQLIQPNIQTINEHYQQEYSRRKLLSSNVNKLLSGVEKASEILPNRDLFIEQQLKRYSLQINSIKQKIFLFQQFLKRNSIWNQNQEQIQQQTIKDIQHFLVYYQKEIQKMKQRLENIS